MVGNVSLPIKHFVGHVSSIVRLKALKSFPRFERKVPVHFETGELIIKTADNIDELTEILKLRHQVFFEEIQNRQKLFRVELDLSLIHI